MAVGKGGARNAALFAVQILALQEPALSAKLQSFRNKMTEDIIRNKSEKLEEHLLRRSSRSTG
jgi:phosphoribosylcarboxyaminoimidazole (NCAIR) mutase